MSFKYFNKIKYALHIKNISFLSSIIRQINISTLKTNVAIPRGKVYHRQLRVLVFCWTLPGSAACLSKMYTQLNMKKVSQEAYDGYANSISNRFSLNHNWVEIGKY